MRCLYVIKKRVLSCEERRDTAYICDIYSLRVEFLTLYDTRTLDSYHFSLHPMQRDGISFNEVET